MLPVNGEGVGSGADAAAAAGAAASVVCACAPIQTAANKGRRIRDFFFIEGLRVVAIDGTFARCVPSTIKRLRSGPRPVHASISGLKHQAKARLATGFALRWCRI